ncbi:hypothetical protein NDR87_00495 [Nocardia sp. CDC159]|uniref:Secreted protein n=1 Tax=Nocardia pulmonis TaxID=2951408 RepID=A0A9X2IW61_9NOCA|nr:MULTISPECIES: hypothetical protein [Nocardia]MCM6772510.1 hypothetical protein [Nocardia pulmonis]MCM6784832.1 hypothetical protein [Nocardia sp. CDC159]
MHRTVTRVALTLVASAATLFALAAPAQAARTTFSTTTLTSGPCVGRQDITASTSPEYPDSVGFAWHMPTVVSGLPIACSARMTLRWHNTTTGASGADSFDISFAPNSCDVMICIAYTAKTGPGRITAELTSNRPHQAGKTEITVP